METHIPDKTPDFSIIIRPPAEIIMPVKKLKDLLSDKIGWYKGKNAEAHITINAFNANEGSIRTWKSFLKRFCNETNSFRVHLKSVSSFPEGAIFIVPSPDCKEELGGLLKSFQKKAPKLKTERNTSAAHMTIGRELNEEQLDKAFDLFNALEIDFTFICDGLYLRKFDPVNGQYTIVEQFLFGNKETQSDPVQVALW